MDRNLEYALERIAALEARLAAAEARIAALEIRPPAILPPVFAPAPAPVYPAPCIPYPWLTTTCGQHHPNSNEVMFTGQHSAVVS